MARPTGGGEALSCLQSISQGELSVSLRASSSPLVSMCTHFVTLSLETVTLWYSVFTPLSCSVTKHSFFDEFTMGVIMLGNSHLSPKHLPHSGCVGELQRRRLSSRDGQYHFQSVQPEFAEHPL